MFGGESVDGFDSSVFEAGNFLCSEEGDGGVGEEGPVGCCFGVTACRIYPCQHFAPEIPLKTIVRDKETMYVPFRPVAPLHACLASSMTTFS